MSRAVDFRSAAASTTGRWGLRIGLALVVALGLVSLAAPIVVSADPTFESPAGLTVSGEPLPFLSVGHPLGTDPKGRDLLARVIYGGRVTLFAAIVAVAIAMLIGLAIGSLGAAFPRRIGAVLMRFTDLGLAIPGVLLAAAIAAVLGRGLDRKSTRLNSSHVSESRMPSSA